MEGESTALITDRMVIRDNGKGDQGEAEGEDDQESPQGPGLTTVTTAVFIVGEMAGTGILALPKALEISGPSGVVILLVYALTSAYTGNILAQSWLIVRDRYKEYRGHVRDPYQVLGQITFGRPGRMVVSFCTWLSMFGSGVVALIVCSQNIQSLLHNLIKVDISFCYMMLFVAAFLCPISWLGTPKDYWLIAVFAAVATFLALIILITVTLLDHLGPLENLPVDHSNPGAIDVVISIGIVMYCYIGHPAFPTFQTDMKTPSKFGRSISSAFLVLTLLYLPSALCGYLVYGKNLDDNILNTISPGPLLYIIQILITFHLLPAFIIVMNPVTQDIEEGIGVKKAFSWGRILVRTLAVASALFVAETIPKFSTILTFVGGSSGTIISLVCPSVFYLKICAMKGDWPTIHVPLHVKVVLVEIVIVGSICGLMSSISALSAMTSPNSFTVPCYVNVTAATG